MRLFINRISSVSALVVMAGVLVVSSVEAAKQPNVVFIFTDDHSAHAISAYGSRVNKTPHIDRIAQ